MNISTSRTQPPRPDHSVWSRQRSVPEPAKIIDKIRENFGFEPIEVDCIRHLLEKKDLILAAKTGFGKSLIFQSLPLLHENGGIALRIMPLLALKDDQVSRINRLEGCKACIVSRETNTRRLRDEIKACKYTHIIVSPEILLKNSFTEILNNLDSVIDWC